MKLLLQAGIHLIKKVITFVIYGRSVQVFKACTLFYFFSAEFFFSQIFLREKGFVPQISQIYTDFFHHDFILFIWSFHYLIIPLQATLKWYTFKLEYKRKWSSKILSAS